jgi:hypothetical protein
VMMQCIALSIGGPVVRAGSMACGGRAATESLAVTAVSNMLMTSRGPGQAARPRHYQSDQVLASGHGLKPD